MKKFLSILLIAAGFLNACSNSNSAENDSDLDEDGKSKKVTSRDYSITPQNAYNDIFLDSTLIASYLDTAQLKKKEKRRFLSFYNARNYQFAWFAKDGLTEQARGFYNLYVFDASHNSDSLPRDRKLHAKMESLFAQDDMTVDPSSKSILGTELQLTRLFIEHGLEVYEDGYVKRKEMERFVPTRKVDPVYIADSLLNKKHKDNKYFEDINENYRNLKNELAKYMAIQKQGGWPIVEMSQKSIKPGTSDPVIPIIKTRLQISGDLALKDTTNKFNPALEEAVKSMQARYGYTPTGVIDQQLVKDMNVPVEDVIKQLLINLDRMRWMPTMPTGNMILVNIPEFVLHVMDGKQKVWDMNVVVGKEGHSTMMFTDELNQVVFSPYWNVPPSIVKNEILPKMETDPGYLASQNMEIVREVNGLPEVRQLPGAKNSLGKVKFLFPNSFNIYFHDTPAKSLFNKDKRAYSHGCIRLSDPEKMASYLLRDQPEWNSASIRSAMNSGEEKVVRLKKPVPVFITYYTAWVDENGKLNIRDDIYGHDKSISGKLFTRKA